MRAIESILANLMSEDIGKLILRVTLGTLMLFHGYHKFVYGLDGIKSLMVSSGFPEFLAYGVYLGEIVFPILLIIGVFTRISSFIYASTMLFAIYVAHSSDIFMINQNTGGLLVELPLIYLLAAVAMVFLGAGKYSFDRE